MVVQQLEIKPVPSIIKAEATPSLRDGRMRIRIKHNAASEYKRAHSHFSMNPEQENWLSILEKISGLWLTVDPTILYEDQYIIPPIEGVTDTVIKVTSISIDVMILNDYRIGRGYCRICKSRIDDMSIGCSSNHGKQNVIPFKR